MHFRRFACVYHSSLQQPLYVAPTKNEACFHSSHYKLLNKSTFQALAPAHQTALIWTSRPSSTKATIRPAALLNLTARYAQIDTFAQADRPGMIGIDGYEEDGAPAERSNGCALYEYLVRFKTLRCCCPDLSGPEYLQVVEVQAGNIDPFRNPASV